ncbi:hypothetical protein ACE103_22545 [Bradyrhizobium sp. ma5]|uniref:hypothetical protein n=1 Tax=unclassified Bradyrhizobium TaxID=2631580 RepID=UPI001CC4AD1C|nr:hypothetical protein [Bradyrhizobium sp. RD5-C2]
MAWRITHCGKWAGTKNGGIFVPMGQWLKAALVIFGLCAGWMVIGYLAFDADDDDVVQTIVAHKKSHK